MRVSRPGARRVRNPFQGQFQRAAKMGLDLSTANLIAAFSPPAGPVAAVWLADRRRHLVSFPYGLPELHAMAEALGIGRRWFHPGRDGRHPHYDIPREREAEILARCILVRPRDILWVIRGGAWPRPEKGEA